MRSSSAYESWKGTRELRAGSETTLTTELTDATAIVHPRAMIGADVRIGPYSVIGPEVTLEDGVEIGNHVTLEGRVIVGARAVISHGAAIGGAPQDLKFRPGTESGVRIGRESNIREYVTIHRAAQDGGFTTIGRRCLVMALAHVAHDCRLGDDVVVINYAGITGYCDIGDHATVGGHSALVPFSRVGEFAYVAGYAKVTKDVPPYVMVDGMPATARAVNAVALRRNGVGAEDRRLVRAAYRLLYRSGLAPRTALDRIKAELPATPYVRRLVEFIETSKRGICGSAGRRGTSPTADAAGDEGDDS